MRLNTIAPAEGSRRPRRRVGRGVGSGLGKTAGRGHKGQKARAGGFHKIGFEGGQMPLHRRLPKRGFTSIWRDLRAEITVGRLAKLGLSEVDPLALKRAGAIRSDARLVKLIAGGVINTPVIVRGMFVSAGAKAAIEAAGGRIELPNVQTLGRLPKKSA
ncbi:MAG: 50S ribosomal protein L15 [Casimicrobiaceae bacterium]|nr:50S ribosomal protein L15 [Casimicrobiaceae bacterium]